MTKHPLYKLYQPKIGKLIRSIRLELGMTQEQFAAYLGVVYPTVNRWENGHTQPSLMALRLIEKLLIDLGERGQEFLQQLQNRL
ncbi:helix-turn-helix domain-containing protein [Gloeothece verrucosa]|uniref:Transcriptional regulator, XRE family n=1 Tax=Gloeothece verrucosa (strain PCC 7822) TaxID=497965 RepID=E0UH73_GLOV7|nr:helix-turn-helix transcriptional regulator [Gloeothece verrucosa]ADN16787.1 transcriptional regulator, XRE family [Gloeothece verrucosa PCC 7822]